MKIIVTKRDQLPLIVDTSEMLEKYGLKLGTICILRQNYEKVIAVGAAQGMLWFLQKRDDFRVSCWEGIKDVVTLNQKVVITKEFYDGIEMLEKLHATKAKNEDVGNFISEPEDEIRALGNKNEIAFKNFIKQNDIKTDRHRLVELLVKNGQGIETRNHQEELDLMKYKQYVDTRRAYNEQHPWSGRSERMKNIYESLNKLSLMNNFTESDNEDTYSNEDSNSEGSEDSVILHLESK